MQNLLYTTTTKRKKRQIEKRGLPYIQNLILLKTTHPIIQPGLLHISINKINACNINKPPGQVHAVIIIIIIITRHFTILYVVRKLRDEKERDNNY
jgi:hypothetical protein